MNDIIKYRQNFIALWVLCILGALSVIPYIYYLGILPEHSIWKAAFLGSFQAALLFGCACWISYKILPKTDLCPFPTIHQKNYVNEIIYPSLISGVLVGLAIFIFDKTIFNSSMLSVIHPPFWAGVLASLYGGVNEEVLLRLFLFSLIYFLFGKFITLHANTRWILLWSTNLLVALLFGIGHLPAAFKIAPPSTFETFRVLFLNGIAGIVFGWLYWSRGLWAAITAHFVTDLMIHVVLITIVIAPNAAT